MKKILILLLIVGVLYVGYEYFKPEEHGPEVEISASTEMESGLWDNILTKPYLTDNVLFVRLNPKKNYTNLSLKATSSGLDFVSNPPVNYFALTKKHVFKIKIIVKPEYKEGSKVDYGVSVIDNSQSDSITTRSYEYEVGKVNPIDYLKSIFWAFAMIVILVMFLLILAISLILVSGNKKMGQEVFQLFSSLSYLFSKFF